MEVQACVAYVTCNTQAQAQKIATILVTEKQAACVSLIPGVTSLYFWEGALQTEQEVILMIKTVQSQAASLIARVKSLHSYTVPEVIVLPIIEGSSEYLNWLKSSIL